MLNYNLLFFLGLALAADSLIVCRKSLLMDASSFRVGTFSSIFRLPFSMRGPR
jgi:hypothetical protein